MSLNVLVYTINLPAVLVAGLAHMGIGLIWFMPRLFGRQWMELTNQELKPARKWIAAGILGHQLIALVLAVIVYLANATTVFAGISIGVLVWVGFVVTLEMGEVIWEKIPFRLFAIRIGNHFFALCVAGAILAVWR